jgi:hypothetical protein
MSTPEQTVHCRSCASELTGAFCSNCGRPRELKRIDGRYLLSEIGRVLNFDKGILYTVRELLLRPGDSIRTFIKEDRSKLIKPIIFVIICSLAYTLTQQLLHFEEAYTQASEQALEASTVNTIFVWIRENYGYANILMAVFIAPWVKVFFRKYQYNIYEILILLFYVMGLGMLIYTLSGAAEALTGLRVLQVGALLGFVYTSWAIGHFFDKRKKRNYLKAFLAYLIGMVTSFGMAILLGVIIDGLRGVG